MTGQTCKDCIYFAADEKECRAKPPTAFIGMGPRCPVAQGVFPPTRESLWCGDFALKSIFPEQT